MALKLKQEDMGKIKSLTDEYASTDMTQDTLKQRLHDLLLPYLPDFKAAVGETRTIEDLIGALIDFFPKKPPYRVAVRDGSGAKELGKGTYVGEVAVYFIVGPHGITSGKNAEEPPPPETVPAGSKVVYREGNPKIVLDNGEVVYGCQVWWEPIDEEVVSV